MKYMEQVKSIVLLLLILLSLTLTFTIWTYTPTYDTIETPIVDIAIADKRRIEDVVKPYRLLYSNKEMLTGSTSPINIEKTLSTMKTWELQTVELINNKATFQQINDYIKMPNRLTIFYSSEIPLKTYSNILTFADRNLPDASFDRLVMEWNFASKDEMVIYFLNTAKQKVYKCHVNKVDKEIFLGSVIKQADAMPTYNEIQRSGKLSLYVSNNPENMMRYTYFLEEIAPEKFKNALFTSPSLVQSNPVGTSGQEFTDDSALMNVDFIAKKLSYVHPASESDNAGKPVELIQQSVNFMNEHNGWTDDYRYNRMNAATQQVSYQLYLFGMPVYSNDTWTEITHYWGLNRVYRYIRPYFTLNDSSLIKTKDTQLPSGQATYNLISSVSGINMLSIDDIVAGYHLSRDDQQRLVTLEPSWYYSLNGSWIRVSPNKLGGGKYGLE